MSKSGINKAQEYYDSGCHNYDTAAAMEDRQESQVKINAAWGLAVSDFWSALVLGSPQAPYSLYSCFGQGVGVKQNDYIANLMFGVALKLGDVKCHKGIKCENIMHTMTTQIDSLYKLIIKTQSEIPASGVDPDKYLGQLTIFNEAIKLPNGQTMIKCLIGKSDESVSDCHALMGNEHHGNYGSNIQPLLSKQEQQVEPIGKDNDEGGCCCLVM